jgi:hypothetical protein
MRHIHWTDIRLRNNAGMDIPVCKAGAKLLDCDSGRLPQSVYLKHVTCPRCKRLAPKRYPWATAGV